MSGLILKAPKSYLSRWRVRHSIKFEAHDEKVGAYSDGVDEWKLTKLLQLFGKCSLKDIYNANKIKLYYCGTPDGCSVRIRELDKTKKSIYLVLGCCTTHSNVSLKNIKLEFVPPNTM